MVLHLRVPAPGNWGEAKCSGQVQRLPGDTEVYDPFFAELPEDEADAVDFCNGDIDGVVCPIREGCLLYALTNNERYGVWGGMTELGRKAIRKKWPWQGGKEPRPEWTWMTTEEALALVTPEELAKDDDDE